MYKYKIFVSIQIFTIHTSVMLFLRVSFRMFPHIMMLTSQVTDTKPVKELDEI